MCCNLNNKTKYREKEENEVEMSNLHNKELKLMTKVAQEKNR